MIIKSNENLVLFMWYQFIFLHLTIFFYSKCYWAPLKNNLTNALGKLINYFFLCVEFMASMMNAKEGTTSSCGRHLQTVLIVCQ